MRSRDLMIESISMSLAPEGLDTLFTLLTSGFEVLRPISSLNCVLFFTVWTGAADSGELPSPSDTAADGVGCASSCGCLGDETALGTLETVPLAKTRAVDLGFACDWSITDMVSTGGSGDECKRDGNVLIASLANRLVLAKCLMGVFRLKRLEREVVRSDMLIITSSIRRFSSSIYNNSSLSIYSALGERRKVSKKLVKNGAERHRICKQFAICIIFPLLSFPFSSLLFLCSYLVLSWISTGNLVFSIPAYVIFENCYGVNLLAR